MAEFENKKHSESSRNLDFQGILLEGTVLTVTLKMATRQASVEKKRASAKDRLAKHRAATYSDPELLEEYRRKERERYRERKENGKLKTTQDLTSRQHERKKKQWRKNSAKYYRKKKQEQALLDLTPDSSLTSTKPGVINSREVSCFCGENCKCFSPMCHVLSEGGEEEPNSTEPTIEVGQWVLVEYDGDLFPGTVTQIAEGQYEVDTMTRVGENRFYVPSIRYPGERVWYYRQDIRDIIPEPLPATSSARHFCILPDIWAKHKKHS